MQYKAARKENKFPFNPLNVTDEEMTYYYNCLSDEVDSLAFFQSFNRSGLLSALYYMAFFSGTDSVKKSAQLLLRSLTDKQSVIDWIFSFLWHDIPRHTFEKHTAATVSKKVPEAKEVSIHDLGVFAFDPIKASAVQANFLTELLPNYFTKTKKAAPAIDAEKIFTPNCPQAKDQATKKEFSDTLEDIKTAQGQSVNESYEILPGATIDGLLRTVHAQYEKESTLLAHHEQVISQTVASMLSANKQSHFDFLSKKRTFPTIVELSILSAKKDFIQRAKALYPELSEVACKKIQQATKEYLQQKQFVQRLSRVEQNIQELLAVSKRDKAAIQTLQNELAQSLEATPKYSLDDPLAAVFMIVETTLNITLRLDQVENIRKFATASLEDRPIVLQMIMGAGKTSVLQPLLAFLFATPDALSTVMVPEALLEPVRLGLSQALGSAFKQSVYTLPYNRELSTQSSYLNTFYKNLVEIRQKGATLLITPRQKYSIITSLYEAYFELCRKDTPENQERVNSICKICHELQFTEVSQIDEIDFIMNPMVIFKYPIGDREVVNTERATLLSELTIACATDEKINKNVSLDFAKRFQERMTGEIRQVGASITKDIYSTVVQPQLVKIGSDLLMKRREVFQKILQPGYDRQNYLKHFMTKSTPFDEKIEMLISSKEEKAIIRRLPKSVEALMAFSKDVKKPQVERLIAEKLLFRKNMLSWIMKEIPDKESRELLGATAQAIAEIFPTSLLSECGTHYGIDLIGKKYVARPYEAAGSPKPTMYSNPYQQVIYSTQLALYYGLPREACVEILTALQNQAKVEMQKNSKPLIETDSYDQYVQMMQEKAANFSFLETPIPENFLKEFQSALSKNPKWLLYYMKGRVFTQISRHEKSIFITPSTLAGCAKKANGYTGTLDEGILAKGVQAIPEKGTDGKTINAVESKHPSVVVIKEEPGKKLPDAIIERLVHDKDRYVWTDSDGWLKDANIETFTEKLLLACEKSKERKAICSIVYHNAKGAICSLERDSQGKLLRMPIAESQYKPQKGKSLTIIQQKYETGTNILQLPTAKDDMNARKKMSLRDALQSIFRMRQILLNQHVDFPIRKEVEADICAQIIDGLMHQVPFKQLLSKESSFDPALLDKMNLEPELTTALKLALQAIAKDRALIDRYKNEQITPKEFLIAFLNLFTEHFTVDSKTMWRYFVANLSAIKLERHWHTGRQRMREVVEAPMRKVLIDIGLPISERKKLFKEMEDLVISTEEDSPFNHMATGTEELDAKEAIEKETARYVEFWNRQYKEESTLFGTKALLSPEIRSAIKGHAYGDQPIQEVVRSCVDESSIPEVVEVSQTILGQEIEQESERESEEEIERELEVERETRLPDKKRYQDLVTCTEKSGYQLSEFFKAEFRPIAQVVPKKLAVRHSERLFYSPNLFIDRAELGSKTHGTYHLPGRFLLAIDEPNRARRYLMVSHEDASRIKKGLHSQAISPPRQLALFTFDGQIVAASDLKLAKAITADDQHHQIVVQAKVLAGRANFTKTEVTCMLSCLPDASSAHTWRTLYENIIKYKPSCAKRYYGGNLEKMFSEFLTQEREV